MSAPGVTIPVWSVLATCALTHAVPAAATELPVFMRGNRSLLILSSTSLSLTLKKRDLNIYANGDPLHALLLDSERHEIARLDLPDDGIAEAGGGLGVEQQVSIDLEAPGASGPYVLQISGNGDAIYGLETSAPQLVASGPIMLNDPGQSSPVFFAPPDGAFTIATKALHLAGVQQLPLLDGAGALVHTFNCAVAGEIKTLEVAAGQGDRSGLWRFEINPADVLIEIDPAPAWTTSPTAHFDPAPTHWMLLDYSRTLFLEPGAGDRLDYVLRNRTGVEETFDLSLVCPAPLTCSLRDSTSRLLAPGVREEITIDVLLPPSTTPGVDLAGHLIATGQTHPYALRSAGVRVLVESSPVPNALELPIVNRPFRYENFQFGYAPDYVANEVYFDLQNRPVIRHRTEEIHPCRGLTLLEEGEWQLREIDGSLQAAVPDYHSVYSGAGFIGAKVAFDNEGGIYTPLNVRRTGLPRLNLLLYTGDRGQSFQVFPFVGSTFDIETFTGHNHPDGPPALLGVEKTGDHPADWASYHDLWLYLPRFVDGNLELGAPVPVSNNCVGTSQHSGGPPSLVTRNGKTHVVWGEIAPDDAPGVPTYVATYDHDSQTLGPAVLLTHAPPVNDVHNMPGITTDSAGYLHVVTGSHGEEFKYLRSLLPDDVRGGWTEPELVLESGYVDASTDADGRGRQTYLSLLCDPDDTLHIAFRQWRGGLDAHHGGALYAALSYQQRPVGGPWSDARVLVVPPVPSYSIYYHKLTMDRLGTLYLSYSHWTDNVLQDDYPAQFHHRAVLTSRDRGASWKLATTADFAEGVRTAIDGGVSGDGANLESGVTDGGPPDEAVADRNELDRIAVADGGVADRRADTPPTERDRTVDPDHTSHTADTGTATGGCDCNGGAPPWTWLALLLFWPTRRWPRCRCDPPRWYRRS